MASNPKLSAEARFVRAGVTTALAAGLLTGCTVANGAQPSKYADRAQSALSRGNADKAVNLAEQAVQADPRNPAFRSTLGDAYLRAGRFASARQAYDEAMQLGDDKGRTALSLALADVAQGNTRHAMDTLSAYRDSIPASDYGLAVALAGQPKQGVAVLANLLRSGENTVKVRQNLAYAYALDGQWAQARVMAAQDVPADQIDARITEWALNGKPEDANKRVAMLLKVPVAADRGEPQALALANFPSTQQLADEAAKRQAAPALAAAAKKELPAVAFGRDTEPQPAVAVAGPAATDAADSQEPTAPAALAQIDMPQSETASAGESPSGRFVSNPVVQHVSAHRSASAPAPATHLAQADGTHLVQLGAFSSAEGADRAWTHFTRRDPALKNYQRVTAHVVINGHDFWRVMVAGLNGYGSASSLCGQVKARGGACFVRLDTEKVNPGRAHAETRMARS